jgi:hypothetical protein
MMLTRAGTQQGFTRARCEVTPWLIRAERDEVNRSLKMHGGGDRPYRPVAVFI